MKLTRSNLVILIVSVVLAFASGYATAISHVRQCETQNRLLRNDLGRAVAKGVVVQTHLELCQNELQGAKK